MTIARKLNFDPMPHQAELARWRPPSSVPDGPVTIAVLGGWGSAKTSGVGYAFARACLRRGRRRGDGYAPGKGPEAVVMGLNARLAKRNQLDLLKAIFGPDLIKREWGMPDPKIQLVNDLTITAISAEAHYDGENLVACWIDEIHREIYSSSPEKYTNMIARLRDPKAIENLKRNGGLPYLPMYVSGLPTFGWVRDRFENADGDPSRVCFLWSTAMNVKLPPGVLAAIRRDTPAGEEGRFLDGRWQPPLNALFPQFDSSVHLTDVPGNRTAPVSIGLDVGNRSAIVVGQRRGEGLHVVDEVLGDGLSVAEVLEKFRTSGWALIDGKSEIYVDPTLRRDEVVAIRLMFPRIHVKIRERTDEYWDVERGIRLVQSSLRDANRDVRLTFARHLRQNKRGVVESLEKLERNPQTGTIKVDDLRDHPNDALRYLVCGVLGRPSAPVEVSRR